MPEKVFFQCSLPRSGSTMFQNLMNQDPRIFASANNGLLGLLHAAKNSFSTCEEFKAQDASLMGNAFNGFCSGSVLGYYSGITDKVYALDKSRGNFADYNMINEYYPSPKIICFVRNIPDIIASIEKLFRKNQHRANLIVNNLTMDCTTTWKRANFWQQTLKGMIDRFIVDVNSGVDQKMLFIKYESFCVNPEYEMSRVYDFLQIPPYKHSFNNISQTVFENEEIYGYTGLLKIRSSLELRPSDARVILGNDVYEWLFQSYQWYNTYFGYN